MDDYTWRMDAFSHWGGETRHDIAVPDESARRADSSGTRADVPRHRREDVLKMALRKARRRLRHWKNTL